MRNTLEPSKAEALRFLDLLHFGGNFTFSDF